MRYKFVIFGPTVPYTRTTNRAKFVSPQWKRYAEYKAKIVATFLNSIDNDDAEKRKFIYNYQMHGKPIVTTEKAYVLSIAFFANKRHGDPDNCCVKAVLDSLFVSDKNVAGAFDFHYDDKCPRLEIMIFDDIKEWKTALKNI